MNSSVYVFGSLGNGYTQYPDDYAKEIYNSFWAKSTAPSQIIIHRDNALMYYGYIRKLDYSGQYIGFCVLLNGIMFSKVRMLFSVFERAVADLVTRGEILYLNEKGNITSAINNLSVRQQGVERIVIDIQNQISLLGSTVRKLPPVNYSISNTESKFFSESDKSEDITNASFSYGYTCVFKQKDYDSASLSKYKSIISKLNKQLSAQQTECGNLKNQVNSLKSQVLTLKNKQRNTLWVSVFAIAALFLGIIVWTQVLFPSEVTKKDMGEYVYYGPMKAGMPNGIGVAIYHDDDQDQRLYYYGNFTDGERIDENAIMFYKDGSYYRGSMHNDQWQNGIFFDVEKEHFIGKFHNNQPWSGEWYKHVLVQKIEEGEQK